jgi:tyrosine-protein kinase Etk/Wzc
MKHAKNALVEATPHLPAQAGYAGAGAMPYASQMYFDGGDTGTGLRGLANTLMQHASLIVGTLLGVLALAILYLLLATPIYRADALLQVEERRTPTLVTPDRQNNANAQQPTPPLLGEIEILRSRDLMLRAASAAGLDVTARVDNRLPIVGRLYSRWWEANYSGVAPAPLGLSRFAWGGERVQIARFDLPEAFMGREFILRSTDRRGDEWQLFDERDERVAEGNTGQPSEFMLDGQRAVLHVTQLRGLPGVAFSLVRHSPAAVFEQLSQVVSVTEATRQSNVVRVSYEGSQRQQAQRLLDVLTTSYVTNTVTRRAAEAEQTLKFLEAELPELKRRLDQSEQALSTFRSRTNTLSVDAETQSNLLRSAQLERDRVDLRMKAQQLSQRYLPSHPELQSLSQQLRIVEGELGRINGQSSVLPANQRDYVRLQREVQTNAALYTALLTSAQEMQLARASMIPTARVVDPPSVSDKPVRPKPALVIGAATAIGLVLGLALAFLRRQMHPTVQDAEDIELSTGLLTLAHIPESATQRKLARWSVLATLKNSGKPQLLALHEPSEPAIESLRSFRSNLTLPSAREIEKTVLIAAATAGLGKTFIAANLAALLAATNKRVLLIDADLRRPRLHRYFRANAAPGLAEILSGEMEFRDVVRSEAMANLDLLLAGRARRNPGDLLLSPNLRTLLDTLEQRYDCVVIDSPPVLPVSDALAFAQFGLQTFLVARSEHSTVREVREAARRLDAVGGRVQGVLFNGVKRGRFAGIDYGYAYPTSVQ